MSKSLNQSLLKNDYTSSSINSFELNTTSYSSSTYDDYSSSSYVKFEDSSISNTTSSIYKYDFCLVVPNPNHTDVKVILLNQPNPSRLTYEEIVDRLIASNLQFYSFLSGDGDEIYIKIRASIERLEEQAEKINQYLLLDSTKLEKIIDNPLCPMGDDTRITSYSPYELIYTNFTKENREFFTKSSSYSHPFSDIVRIKLIYSILISSLPGCANLNLRKLKLDGNCEGNSSIVDYYPIHNEDIKNELNKNWIYNWKIKPWNMPLDDIKEYFGEKIGYYFTFFCHYTIWLFFLSIISIFVIINLLIQLSITENINDTLKNGYTIPFFCIFVSFWSQFMIEYWKRKENIKSLEWGMFSYENEEITRPEYYGEYIKSLINGQDILYFHPKKKFKLILKSFIIILILLILVIGCVSFIFYLQYIINSSYNDNNSMKIYSSTFVSIISSIQIILLNQYYSIYAIKLTESENHRTDTEFDDSLILKLFVFSFINSYASLFFIAFLKTHLGDECSESCMLELSYQLSIIFISKISIEKVVSIVSIWINKKLVEKYETDQYVHAKKLGRTIREASSIELQKRLLEYNTSMGIILDYNKIFLQFGYVTLFVAACPIAPIAAYISNVIEIRLDGNKLLNYYKRVIPIGCQDIGTWLVILQVTACISVITNAAILCFTMGIIPFDGFNRVWLFIGFQYTIFFIMGVFAYLVDDIPYKVQLQLQRRDYLNDRLQSKEYLNNNNYNDNDNNVNDTKNNDQQLTTKIYRVS